MELGSISTKVEIVSSETTVIPEENQNVTPNNNENNGNNTNNERVNSENNADNVKTITTTAGKTDSTTASKTLPKTGFGIVTGVALIAIIILAIVMFKKLKKYDGIE